MFAGFEATQAVTQAQGMGTVEAGHGQELFIRYFREVTVEGHHLAENRKRVVGGQAVGSQAKGDLLLPEKGNRREAPPDI